MLIMSQFFRNADLSGWIMKRIADCASSVTLSKSPLIHRHEL